MTTRLISTIERGRGRLKKKKTGKLEGSNNKTPLS